MQSRRLARFAMVVGCLAALALIGPQGLGGEKTPQNLLTKANNAFDKHNYADAARDYLAFLEAGAKGEDLHHAGQRLIMARLRLQLFDPALEAAEHYVKRTAGTPYEARAARLAGNLYLSVPHWGTRAGGKFHRSQWKQGIHVRSFVFDKRHGVALLERSRDLYAHYDAPERAKDLEVLPKDERKAWHDERIECLFDLAGVCARFGIYENSWWFWYSFWGERDEFLAETAGENDFDEYNSYWQQQRKRPIGLRVGADGNPVFPSAPKEYGKNLSDDEKILFLLAEVRKLDRSDNKEFEALSYYRQAMLSRARFGTDRLNQYAGMYYWGGGHPLQKELEDFNPWQLKDDEALVLAGGRIRMVKLPKQWDVLGLLRVVEGDYGRAGLSSQAQYSIGVYHQSRQQYTTALGEYDKLETKYPGSNYVNMADQQVERILRPQVRVSQAGVQLPGDPAHVQISYRNTGKVWFVARRIDHEGFLRELRSQEPDRKRGFRYFYQLRNWHYHFVNGYNADRKIDHIVENYVGQEVARWSEEVKNDGTHRYATATLQIPMDRPGAYLVYAYLNAPPVTDADKRGKYALTLGDSRAVVSLTDLAIVDKKVEGGNLFFICNARTGAPVPKATVRALEIWSTYNRKLKRSEYFREMHEVVTDEQGLALLRYPKRNERGQMHLLVRAGSGESKRVAWSGMSYWSYYNPSRMRSGTFAYCITDRPVYRPGQEVRFKVWMRTMQNGIFSNRPDHSVTLTVYDVRGNKVHESSHRSDQYGGFDGSFTLGEEPALGMYRLQVSGQSYAGGQNFRVEEYKKPEFEVTVEPGKTHTKLGDVITASIKAEYFFGGAVTEASVKYKVFREEYRHRYYFPGVWDWLYGPGYGWAWYDYDWYPWWGAVRCCRIAPVWWWGWHGRGGYSPIRELVQQGEAAIGHDGKLEVKIDTAPALRDHPDRDHRYVIQAEVRDQSRRVITGEGSVKVTRQAYYAMVQPQSSYVRPGQEFVVKIRCATPANTPVKAEGVVTISEVVFGGPNNAHIKETQLQTWKASTDERGNLEFRLRHEKSGQLKIKFEAPDEWGGVVEGYGIVWVAGDDFDGRLQRFNDLEILTDKRSYEPGEVAHVLINTKRDDSYVLFSDNVDNNHMLSWKLLHLPKRTTVVDVPITREGRPNFFIEATTVSGTRVHQQVRRIVVPPAEGVLNLTVTTDKPEYGPGERARIDVTATTLNGEPVQAQVTVSAFDKSVLYIQPELTPAIAKFFHGNLRRHSAQMTTNLVEQFSAWGDVMRPFQHLYPLPPAWYGLWGPSVRSWQRFDKEDVGRLGGSGSRRQRSALKNEARANGFEEDALADRAEGEVAQELTAAGTIARGVAGKAAPAASPARKAGLGGGGGAAAGGSDLVEAEVRKRFADTAAWVTTLTTGADGKASTSFDMPDNLTTWKINAWGITTGTRVGQDHTSAVTTKNLLVRLQAPRFFVEYDEVVISANVHNYLKENKTARVSLAIPEKLLKLIGETPATVDVEVPAGGEKRVDWRVSVLREGVARLTVKALTNEESDATRMSFPVLVHGMLKQVATTGSMRPGDEQKTLTVELDVPEERKPELTRLEVQFAPSLVGSMLDALPYCLDYPYGCTEQTMSRFLPAVLTLRTLRDMGIKLEDIRKIRSKRAEEIRRIEKGENIKIHGNYADSPIFDEAGMQRIIRKSLQRIANMQNGDGGFGWWIRNDSSGYLTSYVLYALLTAREADVEVDANMINRALNFLQNWTQGEMRKKHWGPHTSFSFAAYTLALGGRRAAIKPAAGDKRPGDLIERLWVRRDELTLYGKALLSLSMAQMDDGRSETVLQNILQYKEENAETQVAWFRTPDSGWWYWWNNDIETNAWCLRALVKLRPKSDLAPRLVKWLLNNRHNGYYWRSTRDTTLCVAAMADFVRVSGEGQPDYTLRLDLDDGAVVKEIKINRDTFFTYDNKFVVDGVALGGGKHTLKITKTGPGALYFNTYLRYFTKERNITASGHELKVERSYFRLKQIPYEVEVEGSEGQKIKERRLRYERVPVNSGDEVKSGDVIQVELKITSDNTYTYLAFEDMKPAGCETTQVRSGGKGQEGFYSYMELRDEKVVFFVQSLEKGEHLLRYRLRAEVPGLFHALPAKLFAMYVPELRANSNEKVIRIVD